MPVRAEYPSTDAVDNLTYRLGANSRRIRLVLAIVYSPFVVIFIRAGAVVETVFLLGILIWVIGGITTVRRLFSHPKYQLRKFKQILLNQNRVEYSQLKGEMIVMEPTWDGWEESRWLSYVEDPMESNVSVSFR